MDQTYVHVIINYFTIHLCPKGIHHEKYLRICTRKQSTSQFNCKICDHYSNVQQYYYCCNDCKLDFCFHHIKRYITDSLCIRFELFILKDENIDSGSLKHAKRLATHSKFKKVTFSVDNI